MRVSDVPETQTITYTRKKKIAKKKQITFKLDMTLLEQLNEYVAKHDKKKVDIVEEALKDYLNKE